jgi:hypothetical protein
MRATSPQMEQLLITINETKKPDELIVWSQKINGNHYFHKLMIAKAAIIKFLLRTPASSNSD